MTRPSLRNAVRAATDETGDRRKRLVLPGNENRVVGLLDCRDQLGLLTFEKSSDWKIERRRERRKRLLRPQTVRSRSKQAHGLCERRSRQGAIGGIEQADQSVGPLPSHQGE